MFTKSFWKQTAERAVKSAAQGVAAVWVGDGFNVLSADWKVTLGAALTGAGLSVLTSIITSGGGEPDSPSAVKL
jgi:hypothetical protein